MSLEQKPLTCEEFQQIVASMEPTTDEAVVIALSAHQQECLSCEMYVDARLKEEDEDVHAEK